MSNPQVNATQRDKQVQTNTPKASLSSDARPSGRTQIAFLYPSPSLNLSFLYKKFRVHDPALSKVNIIRIRIKYMNVITHSRYNAQPLSRTNVLTHSRYQKKTDLQNLTRDILVVAREISLFS